MVGFLEVVFGVGLIDFFGLRPPLVASATILAAISLYLLGGTLFRVLRAILDDGEASICLWG